MGSGFIWLRTGTGAGWWEYANEPSHFLEAGDLLTNRATISVLKSNLPSRRSEA